MARSKTPVEGAKSRFGEYAVLSVGDLQCYPHIQRQAPPHRVEQIAKAWDDGKGGILLVALLTDGEYAGEWHVYDGGTRRAACERANGRDYTMPCWVREMSEQDAADQMLTFNLDSRKPGQYDLFRIGLEAERAPMLAVKVALDRHGLVAGRKATDGSNGEPPKVAALGKCLQLVEQYVGKGHGWDAAAAHLAGVFDITRAAYENRDAYKGDLLQAVHRLTVDNQRALASKANRRRLADKLAERTLKGWEAEVSTVQALGGSDSRGNYLAHFVGTAYNRRLAEEKKLRLMRFMPAVVTTVVQHEAEAA